MSHVRTLIMVGLMDCTTMIFFLRAAKCVFCALASASSCTFVRLACRRQTASVTQHVRAHPVDSDRPKLALWLV